MIGNNWFKLWTDILIDVKMCSLDHATFRAWILCLNLAAEMDDQGKLPDDDQIAWSMYMHQLRAETSHGPERPSDHRGHPEAGLPLMLRQDRIYHAEHRQSGARRDPLRFRRVRSTMVQSLSRLPPDKSVPASVRGYPNSIGARSV